MAKQIIAKKGGGGGGSTYKEYPNTLQANANFKALILLSEGPIMGLTNGLKSVYFDGTQVMSDDGSFNYGDVSLVERLGTADQDYIPGFYSASNEVSVSVDLLYGQPQTRTVSDASIDIVHVTINLPEGLVFNDTSSNASKKTNVSFQIQVKPTSATEWITVLNHTWDDKTTSAYEESFRVDRPTNAVGQTWDVRVSRMTPDSATSSQRNKIQWTRMTEAIDAKLPYLNSAINAINVSAKVLGNTLPAIGFRIKGLIVRVPANYDPLTRTYTGMWDGGTYKYAWTNNPAWCALEILTNERWGGGRTINDDLIDHWAFYECAQYCDEQVTTNGVTSPRFTFNYQIAEAEPLIDVVNKVAGAMQAKVVWLNQTVSLIQDRPRDIVKIFNRSNVIAGKFTRSTTDITNRSTAVNVTWFDPDNHCNPTITSVEADADTLSRYGLITQNITAIGCTNEQQAIRYGRWYFETEQRSLKIVKFSIASEALDLMVGDVVGISDSSYAGADLAGRLISATLNTLVLDRDVEIENGSTVMVTMPDGTVASALISNSAGITNTVTLASSLSAVPLAHARFIIKTPTVAPETYSVSQITIDENGVAEVTGIQYDKNKYSRIDSDYSLPPEVYSKQTIVVPSRPTNLMFSESGLNHNNVVTRKLTLAWDKPNATITNYLVSYRVDSGTWVDAVARINNFELEVTPGSYEFRIYAVGVTGLQSAALEGSYDVVYQESSGSNLSPPTELRLTSSTTSIEFDTFDLNYQFTNPFSNGADLRDFKVEFYSNGTLLRTRYLDRVTSGAVCKDTYSFTQNQSDGGPHRSISVRVFARDVLNKLSASAEATFNNSPPSVPEGILITPVVSSNAISFKNNAADIKGTYIFRSKTSGFTPSLSNLIITTTDNYVSDVNIDPSTTYYYRIAAFDHFSSALDGLNVSPQFAVTTQARPGIASVSSLPASGSEGDIVFNSTDGKLYRYHSGAWTAAVATTDLTGTLSSSQIAAGSVDATKFASGIEPVSIVSSVPATKSTYSVFNITDGKTYRWNGTAYVATVNATDISGTLTNAQIASLAASKITGTLTDAQIAALSASKITGTLVASQIADAAITTAKFASGVEPLTIVSTVPATKSTYSIFNTTDGKTYRWNGTAYVASVPTSDLTGTITSTQITDSAITTVKLAANAVTAAKIAAGTITANEIATDTITAGNIAAGAITSSELAAGAVTAAKIAAGTITANEIAADAITAAKIAAGAVGADEIAAGSITAEKIATGTITANEIAAATITGAKIAAGTIATGNIAADTITAANIAAGAITSSELAANSVVAGKIAAGVITTTEIAANTITAGNLAALTITGAKIAAGTITADKLVANSITAGQIAANTITGDRLVASTITGDLIAANTITGAKIAAGTVTADKIDTRGLDIKDASGVVIFSSGTNLDASRVAGLGAFATANQITSANASTFIASAAIGSTQIGDAAITTAKIGDAQISTIKISDNAITVPVSAQWSGSFNLGSTAVSLLTTPATDFGGQKVQIQAAWSGSNRGNEFLGAPTAYLEIYRNSTLIHTQDLGVMMKTRGSSSPFYEWSTQIVAIALDAPGAGAHVYEIKARISAYTINVTRASVLVMGVKK